LDNLNEAFIAKILRKLLHNHEASWVQAVSAKYLQRGTIWHNTRFARCTKLWKGMMSIHDKVAPYVKMLIGDGTSAAFSNPWHHLWRSLKPTTAIQRSLRVKDLVDINTNTWCTEKLILHFGFHLALFIVVTIPTPQLTSSIPDRLVFTACSQKWRIHG
jgi:hypothetical protein